MYVVVLTDCRAREPRIVYAAAAMPPTNASASPTIARVDTVKSTPDTTSTPANANPRPTTTLAPYLSPCTSCQATIHASCRVTSAVADATEVSVSDDTQVAKCRASAAPEMMTSRRRRPFSAASSSRRRVTAVGASAIVANALRQKAIASGGTTAAAINGPDSETAKTATASRRSVRTRRESGTLGGVRTP